MKRGIAQYWAVASGAIAVALVSAPAAAQETEAAAANSGPLGDIVVTARRREETLQKTPISVTAVGEETLRQVNFQQPSDVAKLVPSLLATPNLNYLSGVYVLIRGIGQGEVIYTVDPPIGLYVDGTYIPHGSTVGNNDLLDVERVEVLRGPQGTLFGRNTTGGLVNYVTKGPKDAMGLDATASYGTNNELGLRARMDSGLLGDSGLKASLTTSYRQRDGYVDNPAAPSNRDPGALKSFGIGARIAGEWGPFKLDLRGEYMRQSGIQQAFQVRFATPTVTAAFANSVALGGNPFIIDPTQRLDPLNIRASDIPLSRVKLYGATLNMSYDFSDDISLKSITSYRQYKTQDSFAFSPENTRGPRRTSAAGPVTVGDISLYYAINRSAKMKALQQELQLSGSSDQFDWTVGGFYYRESGYDDSPATFVTFVPALGSYLMTGSTLLYTYKSSSLAGYGQASYRPDFADNKLELTGGIRFTRDKRQAAQTLPLARAGNGTFNNTSYTVSLNYDWTPDVMTFVRYGTAYRSGGLNVRAGAAAGGGIPLFEPEDADSIEAGIKSRWFDRMLQVNFTAFKTNVKRLQVNQFIAGAAVGTGTTVNAGAKFKGFELEAVLSPVRGLVISADIGHVDPRYTAFPVITGAVVRDYLTDPFFPNNTARFQYLARWTQHYGIQYTFEPWSFGTLTLRGDYTHTSKRWFHVNTFQNAFNEGLADPGRGLFSARATLSEIPVGAGKMEVAVYGDNLANKDYIVGGVDYGALGFAGTFYGRPRTIGVSARIQY